MLFGELTCLSLWKGGIWILFDILPLLLLQSSGLRHSQSYHNGYSGSIFNRPAGLCINYCLAMMRPNFKTYCNQLQSLLIRVMEQSLLTCARGKDKFLQRLLNILVTI